MSCPVHTSGNNRAGSTPEETTAPAVQPERQMVTLGFDIKLTPQGKPAIIEVNGVDSGIKGFVELVGASVEDERMFTRLELLGSAPKDLLYNRADRRNWDLDSHEVIDTRDDRCKLNSGRKERAKLVEIMSRWWKPRTEDQRREVLKPMLEAFVEWRAQDPRHEEATIVAGVKLAYLGYSGDNLGRVLLNSVIGISRWGIAEGLGLIVECFDNFSSASVESQQKFFELLYRKFPLQSSPKHILVDDEYWDRSMWVHPGHWLHPSTVEVTESHGRIKILNLDCRSNSAKLQAVTHDKVVQKDYLPPQLMAPFFVWTGNVSALERFIDDLSVNRFQSSLIDPAQHPYAVVKERRGSHGHKVHIVALSDRSGIVERFKSAENESILLEGFVPSKAIRHPRSADQHDGCMRYLVDCEVRTGKQGRTLVPFFEVAYWRLSPEAVQSRDYSSQDLDRRFKANLTGEHRAIPRLASPAEIAIARAAVEESLALLAARPELF